MSTPQRTVRHLRLAAPSRDQALAMLPRLEDALRCASLPDHATAEQKAQFEAGESGELAPLMCVGKDPALLASFEALLIESAEATSAGPAWALVFAAALNVAHALRGNRP